MSIKKEITMKIIMFKKIAVGSVLAIYTCLAMVGQANAAPSNPTHYGMNVNDGPLSKLNLTKKKAKFKRFKNQIITMVKTVIKITMRQSQKY